MIVKKLSDARGGRFPGAKYNEDKVAAGIAELMLMANVNDRLRQTVGTMHHFGLDATAEVERYLKERSKTSIIQRLTVFSSTCRHPLKVAP